MNTHISTLQEIEKECAEIQSYLEVDVSEDPDEIIERGNKIAVYVSRTTKLLADAKYHLNEKLRSDVIKMLADVAKTTPFASSKTVNALLDSMCNDERYLVNWVERLNAACTHTIDWYRTLISKAKADLFASKGMNQ